tara:strand:- start:2771 stop:3838 length:1068 start_codon:yes stop_codon:yes gene_type:complete
MKTQARSHFGQIDANRAAMRCVAFASLLALGGFVVSGCNRSRELSDPAAAPVMQIVHQTEKSGVTLTSAVDHRVTQVAQPVHLEMTVQAPIGVSVNFPDNLTTLGPFQIVDMQQQFDIPLGDKRLWKRIYTLESLVSGKKEIPPIQISFVDRRSAKPLTEHVSSAAVELEITSLLEGQVDPTQFRDIKGAVVLQSAIKDSHNWKIYGISAGSIALLATVALILWHRRQRKHTPAERALIQLAQLEQRDLLRSGETHTFYCCLTDIIRHYIENRYGYRAPKQTTSEFLSAVQRGDLLCDEHQAPLQEFLQVADMVKFACHSPSRDEAATAIGKARQFVHDTDRNDAAKEQKEQIAA